MRYKNVERDFSSGVAVYTKKKTEKEKKRQDQTNPKNQEVIADLKRQLADAVEKQSAIRRSVFPPKNGEKYHAQPTGRLLSARDYDSKQANKNIRNIIDKLAKFGVNAKQDKSGNIVYKNMNEGGRPTMKYGVQKLKQMKLEVFQESAAGRLSQGATDYLLKYFDVMIEAARGEDINTLVTDYVAACKSGDTDKKESLKEKITAATNSKKAKEELCSLKENLTDDEKKFMDDLDAEICGTQDSGEGSSESEAPVEESGEDADLGDSKKAVDEAGKSAEELQKKIKSSADNAGKDNKEAFDQLLSAASESAAITDTGKEAVLDYVTESVAGGTMDADVAVALTTLLSI